MTLEIEHLSTFERGYSKLSSEAQRRCENAIDELVNADDPSNLGVYLQQANTSIGLGIIVLSIS